MIKYLYFILFLFSSNVNASTLKDFKVVQESQTLLVSEYNDKEQREIYLWVKGCT